MVQPRQGLWLRVARRGHAGRLRPYETLRRSGIRELRQGQRVQVRTGEGPKGELAAEIVLIDP